ncbi:hypothetical protein B7G68_10940 [Caulobacter segnis]|uniref:Uncharacterized protein n=2 Tax=Caulobacter segnis TaxID=88688 RepID=D5VJS2_CAUST|nr:hypothetical protein [Caulobacter segnis]ADG10601.1 conserved hypothetical protein [Caulobacter segnis ATCC 21756]AVQ02317.1 hypothetical protein B7G68_10940 [Caulobacter segnis]
MPNPLQLLLPALIPSWNFFDVIAPSPRVEYAVTPSVEAAPEAWLEFRPRPERVTSATMAARLLWNPRWNESLFLVSCAERLIDNPTAHSEHEIFKRIAADLARGGETVEGWLAFRLVFVVRDGEAITREVQFEAAPRALAEIDVR